MVAPPAHHDHPLFVVVAAVIGAADLVIVGVGQRRFDSVRIEPLFVEGGTAERAQTVGHQPSAITQSLEGGIRALVVDMAERITVAGEHKGAVAADRLHPLQQGQRLWGQRNPVGALHLHPVSGDVPNLGLHVYLIPAGARRLTRANQGVQAPFNLTAGSVV
ncbi:hypothetical protein D3C73_914410 [compost metagenome]